jgi:Na+-transporting methylmalonyl-CoA/oxaloacetate decarboxylase gamma subunit
MSKRIAKNEEPNTIAFVIAVVILVLFVKGCSAFCESHREEWKEELRKKDEQTMQEAFYRCKFEHDY